MHRSRSPRRPLVAVALLSLLTPLLLTSTGTAGAAAVAQHSGARASLELSTRPGPAVPFRVDRFVASAPPPSPEGCAAAGGDPRGDDCQDVLVTLAGTAPSEDVTLTVVESDGLYVDPMVTTVVDPGGDTSPTVGFAVRGRTTGLHTLTIEATAPGAEPRTITLPYVWRAGGAPLPGNDSLSGQLYGVDGVATHRCGADVCSHRYAGRLAFLTDKRASRSLAVRAQPTCGPTGRCPRYRYDSRTGLVQVGRFTIGRVTEAGAYFSGEKYAALAYPERGRRLDGTWHFATDVDEPRGVADQYLRLRADGRFRLTFVVDTHRHPSPPDDDTRFGLKRLGTYLIGRNGRLRLNDGRHKATEVATLALVTTPGGRPRAATRGVWLDVSVTPPDFGKPFVDGNRLRPVPSAAAPPPDPKRPAPRQG